MPEPNDGSHKYHAEATALEGQLNLPIQQPIERQAFAKVPKEGGYLSQHAEPFRVEGIVSYSAAHTQVSGHEEEKHGRPYVTLATSVVEDLNILNVVTADRVVAQVSTEHPRSGYVPTVTFLGSQFVNLRIAGHPVEVDLDWDILRDYPGGNSPITRHEGFLECIGERLGIIREHKDAPSEFKERYASNWTTTDDGEASEFSLVRNVKGDPYPARCFGHVIDIPHFGKILLAVVRIEHSESSDDVYQKTLVDLTMIEVRMGCIASGKLMVASGKSNGSTAPPGGGN
jgi:hypothetical protein